MNSYLNNRYDTCYAAALNYAATESNRIEGIRVSDCALQRILSSGIGNIGNIPIDEQVDARNLYIITQKATEDALTGENVISTEYIRMLHQTLFFGDSRCIQDTSMLGQWRKCGAWTGNNEMMPSSDIEKAIETLLRTWSTIDTPNLLDIAQFHITFEKIHPFVDGNGRIGRVLMYVQMSMANMPWGVIEYDNRNEYYRYIEAEDAEALAGLLRREQKAFAEIYLR